MTALRTISLLCLSAALGACSQIDTGNVALEVRVTGGSEQRVNTVGPGDLLGWSPVLNQLPMTAGARALTPVRLIALDAAKVLALCQQDPRFGFTFMRRTA